MRTIAPASLIAVKKKNGTEPVVFLDIQWRIDGPFVRYSTKEVPGTIPAILSIGDMDTSVNLDAASSGLQLDVTLDDSDGAIKHLIDTIDIHKRPCVVYQWIDGLALTEAFEMFRGLISAPVTWNEATRQVSFTILDRIYSSEVGFSIEQGQYDNSPDELTDQPWPVCFGEVQNVKATKATAVLTGNVSRMFGLKDQVLELKRYQLENEMRNFIAAYAYFLSFLNNLQQFISPEYITQQVVSFAAGTTPIAETDGAFKLGYNGASTVEIPYKAIATNQSFVSNAINKIAGDIFQITFKGTDIEIKFVRKTTEEANLSFYDSLITERPALYTVLDGVAAKVTAIKKVSPGSDTEVNFETYSQIIQRKARELENEYAETIVDEDALKQEIENVGGYIDQLRKVYDYLKQANLDDPDDTDIQEKLKAVNLVRDAYLNELYNSSQALTSKTYNKEKIEVDAHNVKYVYNAAKTIKDKCRSILKEYVKLKKKYDQLVRIIKQQEKLLTPNGRVNNGYKFEQDETLDLNIKGVKVRAKFTDGNKIEAVGILPSYTNIPILKPKDEDLDAFWLPGDPSNPKETEDTENPNNPLNSANTDIDLNGHYCLTQDNFIIKVVEQIAGKCRFELISKKSNIQNSPDDLAFMGVNGGMIKDAFSDSLDGDETPEELASIANSVPTDISKKTKDILLGDGNKQILTLYRPNCSTYTTNDKVITETINNEAPTFQLTYRDKITDRLPINIQKAALEDAIESQLKVNVTVKSISTTRNKKTGRPTITEGNFDFSEQGPKDKRIHFEIDIIDTVEASYPIEAESFHLRTQSLDPDGGSITQYALYVQAAIVSTGAREYTAKQIRSKIETSINQSKLSPDLKAINRSIEFATAQIKELTAQPGNASAKEILDQRNIIQTLQKSYEELMSKIRLSVSTTGDAYQLYSDSEYKVMFGLEILHFMAWQHGLDPVAPSFPDPHLQYYCVGRDITKIKATSPVILREWLQPYKTGTKQEIMYKIASLPPSIAFMALVGDEVKMWGDFQETHVANLLPSEVLGVFAFQTVKGLKILNQLPEKYYRKDESNSDYGKYSATTITLKKPLAEYPTDSWSDDIYVSMVSSVGPNPVDIITWVLSQFTDLTLDPVSAATVRAQLTNYPANFALTDKMDALELVREIAYQSRCAAYLKADKVYLLYLPVKPPSVMTFTDSNIKFGTLNLSFTDTDDTVTKYIATYQNDYSIDQKIKLVLRFNVKKFFEIPETKDYFIYNQRSLVEKSATFWLIRRSNVWKIARFTAFLDALVVEPFDSVTLDLSGDHISTGPVQGIVQSVNIDFDKKSIAMEVWIPIISGEMTEHLFAWPAGLTDADIYPRVQDIINGNAGSPFNETVPTGSSYSPFSANPTNIRPKDYGDITPTDLTDTIPSSLIEGTTETAENPVEPEDFPVDPPEPPNDRKEEIPVGGEVAAAAQPKPEPAIVIGTVVKYNTLRTVQTALEDPPALSAPSVDLNANTAVQAAIVAVSPTKFLTQWYDVFFPDGRTVPVRIPQLHPKDTLPANMPLYCVRNPVTDEWEAQPPVWTAPQPDLS